MSMVTLTMLQLTGMFCAYLFVTVGLPAYVFGRKLRGFRVSERLMLYFMIGNFYAMNLVFALQLLKISNSVTLTVGTLLPAFIARVTLNHIPVAEIVKELVTKLRKLIGGQMGKRTALYNLAKGAGHQLARLGRWIGRNLRYGFVDLVWVVFLAAALWWIYGSNLLVQFGYKASDMIVHNYWINALNDNHIFVAGVYPHGFHCMVYYIHEVFGFDIYVVLRIFGFIQNVMIHLMLLCFLRSCCRTKYAAYIGTVFFVLNNFYYPSYYFRYYATLPQEFGILFILPGIYFLFAYFANRRRELAEGPDGQVRGEERPDKKWDGGSGKRKGFFFRRRKKKEQEPTDDFAFVELEELPKETALPGNEPMKDVALVEIDLDAGQSWETGAARPKGRDGAEDASGHRRRFLGIFRRRRRGKRELPSGKRKRRTHTKSWVCLAGFVMSFSMTLAVHFYGTMVAGVFCLAIAAGYHFLLFKKQYFWSIMAAGSLSIAIAVLPMLLAFLGGTPLQGSLYWGMSIIRGEEAGEADAAEEGEGLSEEAGQGTESQDESLPDGAAGGDAASGATDAAGMASEGEASAGIQPGEGGGHVVFLEQPKPPSLGERIRALPARFDRLFKRIWNYTITMFRMAVLSLPDVRYVQWLVASFGVLVALGLVYRLLRQSCYGAMLVSSGLYLIFLCLMLIAPDIGLPALMDHNRSAIYISYSLPIVLSLLADGILALLFLPMKHKLPMHLVSLVCAALMAGGLIQGGFVKDPEMMVQDKEIPLQEPNEAITCLTNIIRGEKDFTWTIVSANDMMRMGAEHGYHYETITFLQGMEGANPGVMIRIPTNVVYFFIEKTPIDYNLPYENSGQKVSREGANRDLPMGSGVGAYQGEMRWVVMSRMYYWAQEFQKMYPDDMEVYLETEDFVCYRLEQNPYRLYNMAINYGYNAHTAEEEEE